MTASPTPGQVAGVSRLGAIEAVLAEHRFVSTHEQKGRPDHGWCSCGKSWNTKPIAAHEAHVAQALAALLGDPAPEVEGDRPGGFWTQTEWSDWSNDLATLISEDPPAGNPDGAQESIITDCLRWYVKTVAAVRDVHQPNHAPTQRCRADGDVWPCLTARRIGVVE